MKSLIRHAGAGVALAVGLVVAMALGATMLAEPTSPVTMTNVGSPSPVVSGGELTWTISMVNTGGSKVTNVVLNDQFNGLGGIGVPPELQIASSRGSCSQTINGITCQGGTIEGGGSWTVTIRGKVLAAAGATLNNTATVTSTRSAQNFTTTSTENVLVSGNVSTLPDLTMTKTGPTSVVAGAPMTYTLTVNNQGATNATDVVVVDNVPADLTGVTAVGTSLFDCTVSPTNSVTCTGGAVNAGSNATITINAIAPAVAGGTLTNTAVVDPEDHIVESNELNNTSALVNTLVVEQPPTDPISINITDDPLVISGAGPDPVVPGGNVTFKMLVTNNASTRADDVQIVLGTQSLEAASVVVSNPPVVTDGTIGNGNGCTVAATEVQCRVRSLNPGGTILVSVTGKVIGFAGSSFISTASVTGNIKNKGVASTDTELTTIKPYVDLTITKKDSPDPVCARSWPGAPAGTLCAGGLKYTLTVGNSGMNAASGVVVRDPLPAGTIFDSFTTDGGFACAVVLATNVLTCTDGTIPAGGTRQIEITLVAPPFVGSISNTATVDPFNAIFEADETNNTGTATTLVTTGIDLSVTKSANLNPVATSGTLIYTLIVENNGPQDATNIRLRDTLPSGTTFRDIVQQTNGFTCSHTAGTLECVGGSVRGTMSESYNGPGGVPAATGPDFATIRFRIFAQSFEGTMHNEVRVDPLNEIPEINEDNNFATLDTQVQRGGASTGAFNQLTIAKTRVTPADPVARNAVVTWKIEIHNDGTDPVSGIIVRDFLPAGSRYIEATGTNNFNCSQVGGYIECRGGQLGAAAGAPPVPAGPATITIKSFAPDTPGTYTNQAIVDPENLIPEGNEFDNQSSAQIVVADGGNGAFNDLQIKKEGPDTAVPLGSITYTIKVWNTGSDPAQNVTVEDVLPVGVTFVSANDGGGPGSAFTCSQAGGIVTCTGATINGNTAEATARIIHITVKAPNENTSLTNNVFVDPDNTVPEGSEQNNTATKLTVVQSTINLTITKTGPPTSSQAQPGQYVITVTNNEPAGGGGLTAFGVKMRDPLPVGLIPLAVSIEPSPSPDNWACQISQNPINLVECIGDLNPNQTVTIKIDVFMTAESGKSLQNEACVDPDDEIEEFDPGNSDNCSTHTTVIVDKSPNLTVTKSATPSIVLAGQELVYTILIHNVGDASAASPLTLTDTLPSDVAFVDANGTDGWTCSFTSPTVTCTDDGSGLAVGAAVTITIRTTVNSGVTAPIVNTASVTAPAQTTDFGAVEEKPNHLADNTGKVTTSVGGSPFDLVLANITDNPDPVAPGQGLTHTIVAVNAGTDAASNVKVAINLPSAGISFVGADGTNGFNCTAPVANVVTCTGDLPAGGDTTITVRSIVLLALVPPADLTLTATVDPPDAMHPNGDFAEQNEGNNSKTEVTTVTGTACVNCIDLVATELKAVPGVIGTATTFTAQIVNVGDLATALNPDTDALVRLTVVAVTGSFNLGSVTFSDPAFAPLCTTTTTPLAAPFTQVVVECRGNLGPSQGLTINFSATGITGNIGAVLQADPNNLINAGTTPPEFSEANNQLVVTVLKLF